MEELKGLKLTRLRWLRLRVRFICPRNQSSYFGGKSRWKKKIKKWNHFVCFFSVKMSVLLLSIKFVFIKFITLTFFIRSKHFGLCLIQVKFWFPQFVFVYIKQPHYLHAFGLRSSSFNIKSCLITNLTNVFQCFKKIIYNFLSMFGGWRQN